MICNYFLSSGTFLNQKSSKKPAKDTKKILIAAVFHFVVPVQKDR